jgi:hypothetical protein
MRRAIYFTLAVTMLPGPQSWAQHPPDRAPIRVVLPRALEIKSCRLEYFLVGSFGGYGSVARPNIEASAFEIETVHEGRMVQRLQFVLACSGYQIETMAFDSLPDVDGRTVQVHPKPLGTVRFRGLVQGLTLQQVEVLYVDVDYTPAWTCEFFRLPDCLLGRWTVTSVQLDTDGRFSVSLPDFARDPVIRSFKDSGEFAFRIRDQKTGSILFELKAAGSTSLISGRVPVADSYAGEHVLEAELAR